MKFTTTLIAVQDMQKSLDFYGQLFGQEVVMDLGANKTLTCGLTLQANFGGLLGIPENRMSFRPNTMELYFETEDFEGFLKILDAHPEVEKLHEAKEFPWLQRGIRIFDPDGHLIEVSESMYAVARKQFALGKDVSETAKQLQHPTDIVEEWHERYLRENISVCGTDCAACYCYGKMCDGCNAHKGKVFHAPEGKACPIYACCVEQNHFKHCGNCGKAPCDIWQSTRDPKYSDEEFAENVQARIQMLKNKKIASRLS